MKYYTRRIIVSVANTLMTNTVMEIGGNISIPNLVYGQKRIDMNKIEKLAGEYNSTFARLAVIESELTKECQKYVSWDTVQVSITGGGAPIVKARGEIDAVPLEDFVNHVNKHENMSEYAYGHLACV